jgi:hypothetical protein
MRSILCVLAAAALLAQPEAPRGEIVYKVIISAPEHHVAGVEVTFPNVTGTLQARMSRSSPGRYAVHEFAKNVYDVHAFDGTGRELAIARPNPYEWDVAGPTARSASPTRSSAIWWTARYSASTRRTRT